MNKVCWPVLILFTRRDRLLVVVGDVSVRRFRRLRKAARRGEASHSEAELEFHSSQQLEAFYEKPYKQQP